VKDHIVNLVVSVHKAAPVLWLRLWVSEELHHFVVVWDFADRLFRINVNSTGLSSLNGLESVQLAVVEARRLAVAFQSHFLWVNTMEPGESLDGILPPENLSFL